MVQNETSCTKTFASIIKTYIHISSCVSCVLQCVVINIVIQNKYFGIRLDDRRLVVEFLNHHLILCQCGICLVHFCLIVL